jgi:hypothetical protein
MKLHIKVLINKIACYQLLLLTWQRRECSLLENETPEWVDTNLSHSFTVLLLYRKRETPSLVLLPQQSHIFRHYKPGETEENL